MKLMQAVLLAFMLPIAAHAAGAPPSGARGDIAHDLNNAKQEVRDEMAQARAQLERENLSVGDGLHFGRRSKAEAARQRALPQAEITPTGDLLIGGKAVPINAGQRQQLLNYRGQVIALARIGIEGGERAALATIEATDISLFGLIIGGMSGSLERRLETSVKQHIAPFVSRICARLPQVMEAQQALAAGVREFRPYANLKPADVTDCEGEVRNELAVQ